MVKYINIAIYVSNMTYVGQPVVWVISDKEDVDTLEVVYMSVN